MTPQAYSNKMKQTDKDNSREHKISIMVENRDLPPRIEIDDFGNPTGKIFKKVKWVEVKEIDLGSIRNPNKEIIEFKIEPLELEKEETDNKKKDFFRRLLDED